MRRMHNMHIPWRCSMCILLPSVSNEGLQQLNSGSLYAASIKVMMPSVRPDR